MMDEPNRDSLAVVIPVYNERDIISEVISDWDTTLRSLNIHYEIHTYDDGSTDDSLHVLNSMASQYDSLVVHTSINAGHGPTLLKGYTRALEFDWIFQIDSDGEMTSEFFEKLWHSRSSYDFLLGGRSQRTQPLSRKIISFISRSIVFTLYGRGIWDVNSPYRLMRVSAFQKFIQTIPAQTFAPNLILSGLSNLEKLRYLEIPIPHQNRQTGEVSIKKLSLLIAAFKSLVQTINFRLHHSK